MVQTTKNNKYSTEDRKQKTKGQISKYPNHRPNICKIEIKLSTQQQKVTTTTNAHRKNRFPGGEYFKLPETLQNNTAIATIPIRPTTIINSPTSTSKSTNNSTVSRGLRISLQCLLPVLLLAILNLTNVAYAIEQNSHAFITAETKYSQPLTTEDGDNSSFRPIIPKDVNLEYISQNVFTRDGQYRIFQPVESDLRATTSMRRESLNGLERLKFDSKSLPSVNQRTEMVTNPSSDNIVAQIKNPEMENKTKNLNQQEQTMQNNYILGIKTSNKGRQSQQLLSKTNSYQPLHQDFGPPSAINPNGTLPELRRETLVSEMKGLENLLSEYVENFFNKGQYQPNPELIIALQKNYTEIKQNYEHNVKGLFPQAQKPRPVRQVVTKRAGGNLVFNIPSAMESGRLLFFSGLKKVMWPLYMGLQILKSLMFALLLPTLIGSFGKLLGKGISSGSAPLFIRPIDEPQDLDFKDNNFNFDDDSNKFTLMDDVKDTGYAYNQAEASQTHNQYAYNGGSINQATLSRYGMNERQQLMQDSYLSALQSIGAASFKNSNGLSGGSSGGGNGLAGLTSPMRQKPAAPANTNTFQQFQKVPTSSLLLSNYDPFYSPLLSRLDSVFAQLKLNSDDEACREKLICLMYANPAKYAPYSNLVSAQLSRELNELRKPTSDNPDILRFFKYMRAAKDGQDGIDCEKSFEKCKEFKDFENPAMVSTYHDINKLVQARKFK